MTISELLEEFRKNYESGTCEYIEKIETLKKLHNNGFKTWVSIEPYPPNIIIRI